MVEIVTERLRLRPFQADDLPAFVAYRREPEVARFQSWEATFSMPDAGRFLASQEGVEFGAPGAWVQLAAIGRFSGTLCGDCGVRVLDDQPATAEVGVTFAPDCQGRGLATEALAAVISKLFDEHELHRVYARSRASGRRYAFSRFCGATGSRPSGGQAASACRVSARALS